MKLSEIITRHGNVDISEYIPLGDSKRVVVSTEKSKLKKIDMSVCIESGIDCEFSKGKDFHHITVGKLYNLNPTVSKRFRNDYEWWDYCLPRMNHIHACPNGFDECPLPEGFRVRVWMANYHNSLIQQEWNTGDTDYKWKNVRMFEVTGIAEGYEL